MNTNRNARISWITAEQPFPISACGLTHAAISQIERMQDSCEDFGLLDLLLED